MCFSRLRFVLKSIQSTERFSKHCYISNNKNSKRSFSDEKSGISSKIIKSPYPDVEIPACTVNEFVWKNLDKWFDKTALVCGETGRKYTYSETYKYSRAFAANLCTKLKLETNDIVAIVLPNIPEYGFVILGIMQANCIVTTINPGYTAGEIENQLKNSGAKVLVTSDNILPVVRESVKKIERNFPIIVVDTKGQGIPSGAINVKQLCDPNTDTSVVDQLSKRSLDDLICLPYSSGTTGLPKGVELTDKNLVVNLIQARSTGFKHTEDTTGLHQDVIPAILPFYHIYGLQQILLDKMSQGCQLVTLPNFTTSSFIHLLNNYKVNQLYLVPPLVMLLISNDNIKSEHLSRTRLVNSGAAPLRSTDIERFFSKFNPSIHVIQSYGLTETGPVLASQNPNLRMDHGSIGRLLPNTQCIIANVESGDPLGPNESGELYVKGPQVMTRYYKNEEATRNTFTEDGWFKTGDMAHYDDEEYFYITDRLKELIKVKGFQVAPAELEALIRTHPHVDDVAVVGIPDEMSGEVPKAFIVPSKDGVCSGKDIQKFVESKVAKHKRLIGGVTFIDAIPKNPSGKILRRQLRN